MILDELSNYARERVALAKEKECLESIKKRAMETKKGEHRFFAALEKEIAEQLALLGIKM